MKKYDELRVAMDAVKLLLDTTPYNNRPCYAPHLRQLGMELLEAIEAMQLQTSVYSLRPDVAQFATKMATVMNIKDAEKGPIDQRTKDEALMKLGQQFEKLKEIGILNNKPALRIILIHIANFAMIAEAAIV